MKACEGSTCPEECQRAHILLVSINAVVFILSSLFSQEKYPSYPSLHQLSVNECPLQFFTLDPVDSILDIPSEL